MVNAYLGKLFTERNIYLIGHSKTNHLNPTAFSPLGGGGGGGAGQNAHTRKKKQTFPSECRKILFKSERFGKVVLNSITVESFQVPTSDIILT